MAGLIHRGTYIWGLSWSATSQVDQSICLPSLWSVLRLVTYTIQLVSTPHCSLRLCPSDSFWQWWRQAKCIFQGQERVKSHWLPESSSQVNQLSCPLNELLQNSTLVIGSYILTHSPFLKYALSGQQGVLPAGRWFLWQLPGCTGGRCHSNSIGTCERKHRLWQWFPKSVTTFSTSWSEPLIDYSLPQAGRAELREFTSVLMCFNKNDTLADFSGMNAHRSVWIIAQLPPCKAIIMSKAILFGAQQFFSLHTFSVW